MDRSPSPPPSKSQPNIRTPSPEEGSVVLRPRKLDLPRPHDPHTSPTHSPRLMLPPPPSPRPRLYQILHHPTFIGVTKISLFCAKVVSLFSPCQPFAADPWVAYPLLFFASLDFLFVGFTFQGRYFGVGGLGGSALLLGIHVAILMMLLRWDRLCLRRGVAWDSDGL